MRIELMKVTIQRWTVDAPDEPAVRRLQDELTVEILEVNDPRVVRVQENSFVGRFD